jgi:hypothetical protein
MNSVGPDNNIRVDDFAVSQRHRSCFCVAGHYFAVEEELRRGPAYTFTSCKALEFVIEVVSVTEHGVLTDFSHTNLDN